MHQAAAGALVLLAFCAQRETPARAKPKAVTTTHEVKAAPVPPAPPRSWRVTLLRSGGFHGGMQAMAASSDRAREHCNSEVERALAEAHPQSWQRSYPASEGITDQFHYMLTLKANERTFQSAWSTGSDAVPPDLAGLADTLKGCR